MPDLVVFSLLEFRKRKSRSHGKDKKEMTNVKVKYVKTNSSLHDLLTKLRGHG